MCSPGLQGSCTGSRVMSRDALFFNYVIFKNYFDANSPEKDSEVRLKLLEVLGNMDLRNQINDLKTKLERLNNL